MKLNKSLKTSTFFNFNLFSHKTPIIQPGFFINYYIIARRAHYSIVNPFSVSDTLTRLFIVLKCIISENKHYSKWVFSFCFNHIPVGLWFSWSIKAGFYASLNRDLGIISNAGQLVSAKGLLATHLFINFIGVDIAFILSSKNDGGKSNLITHKSILTIGFDGSENWNYAFTLPGTKSVKTALLYSRILLMLMKNRTLI